MKKTTKRALGLSALALLTTGFDCGSTLTSSNAPPTTTWTAPNGKATVTVTANPFAFTISDPQGGVLLESANVDDPAYGAVAYTHDTNLTGPAIVNGWDNYSGEDAPFHKARLLSVAQSGSAMVLTIAGDGDDAHTGTITFADAGASGGIRIIATVGHAAGGTDTDDTNINRVSFAFKMHDDDHFLGFGERVVYVDERGQKLKTWVEEDGFGHGEDTPIGPGNPQPNGPDMTHVPVPWILSPKGFGLFQNTIDRVNYHLGEERDDAWRVESTTQNGTFDAVLFTDPEPAKLIEGLTAITGRPPPVSDWFLAPRRRANIGTDEFEKLRANHVPTTSIDTAFHYFPHGLGTTTHDDLKKVTADLHARGYKAITYFCPFVDTKAVPEFQEAVDGGFLVKRADGTPYTMLDTPITAGIVDFTNPAATAWFQSKMQGAIDDGWDGWMYDFAEYVPIDAVMFNGMKGLEAHNVYTNLYQKAAMDIVGPDRLIFVRSGYSGSTGNGSVPITIAGTGGLVPMLWAGDQATDFDLAQGLPSALVSAINAGVSGLPLWSSDISGYHYVYNPPPDKEVYIRWTELGAFSVDMHDENEGAGNGDSSVRWQIWKDAETLDTYRSYASLKTQMIPYLQTAVAQARTTGMPIMRHLVIGHAKDPKTYAIADEYMFGDSLLVAPVVTRGLTSRSVYLPDDAYYDWWTGARVIGHQAITADAPLDIVPLYALEGAIIPMLDASIESLFPATTGTIPITAGDMRARMEVRIFAGNSTQITIADGTTFTQSAPATNPNVSAPSDDTGAIPLAASEADTSSCARCAYLDSTAHKLTVVDTVQNVSVTAGDVSFAVKGASESKRYLFVVRF